MYLVFQYLKKLNHKYNSNETICLYLYYITKYIYKYTVDVHSLSSFISMFTLFNLYNLIPLRYFTHFSNYFILSYQQFHHHHHYNFDHYYNDDNSSAD